MFTQNQTTGLYIAVMSALLFAGFTGGIVEYQRISIAILWIFSVIGLALYIAPVKEFLLTKMHMLFPVGNSLLVDAIITGVILFAGHWVLAIAYSIAAFRNYLPVNEIIIQKKRTRMK